MPPLLRISSEKTTTNSRRLARFAAPPTAPAASPHSASRPWRSRSWPGRRSSDFERSPVLGHLRRLDGGDARRIRERLHHPRKIVDIGEAVAHEQDAGCGGGVGSGSPSGPVLPRPHPRGQRPSDSAKTQRVRGMLSRRRGFRHGFRPDRAERTLELPSGQSPERLQLLDRAGALGRSRGRHCEQVADVEHDLQHQLVPHVGVVEIGHPPLVGGLLGPIERLSVDDFEIGENLVAWSHGLAGIRERIEDCSPTQVYFGRCSILSPDSS